MARNLVCSECGGNMQIGYIALPSTFGDNATVPDFWIEGSPKINFLGLTTIKGRSKHEVVAYRCERCGLLKFYAGLDHPVEK